MTREQVRFVLGTPLVADIFHADRWDYVFYRETPDGKREQRNLSVVFEKDKLARVVGDLLPPEGAAVQSSGFAPQVKPQAPAPAKPAAEAAKPAAAAPKPAAEDPAPAKQNWRAASDEPEKKPEPANKPEPAPVAKEDEPKPAEEANERGFFGRLLEKIGL
jgi:outer membrane protein assembly factor BamE